jgi:signal peptidase I
MFPQAAACYRRTLTLQKFTSSSSSSSSSRLRHCFPRALLNNNPLAISSSRLRLAAAAAGRPALFSGGRSRAFSKQQLPRKERRLLERQQRKRERKEGVLAAHEAAAAAATTTTSSLTTTTTTTTTTTQWQKSILLRIKHLFHLKFPGTDLVLRRQHWVGIASRLPFWLLLCYLLTSDDTAPLVIQGAIGPSMLPTFQFIGDIFLISTGAWWRLLGLHPTFQVGDIVLWRDPETGRVASKRVIGVEGDQVLRHGQHVHLYQNRDDWGIVWPKDSTLRNLDSECKWDTGETLKEESRRRIQVPSAHVWLEGDFPPFSLDSRHYGPIPIDWIRGRLLLRVWPLRREDNNGPVPHWVSRERPVPFPTIDQYLGKRYNFYRVPKDDSLNE